MGLKKYQEMEKQWEKSLTHPLAHDCPPDEYNELLLAARDCVKRAMRFAPCTGPEVECWEIIKSIERAVR